MLQLFQSRVHPDIYRLIKTKEELESTDLSTQLFLAEWLFHSTVLFNVMKWYSNMPVEAIAQYPWCYLAATLPIAIKLSLPLLTT